MAYIPQRRRWLLVLLTCCIISVLYVSHDLYFSRGYWAKSPELISLDPLDTHVPSQSNHTNTNTNSTNTTTISTPHSQRTLIVSAMFPLEKSKHPSSDYVIWLHNFFLITTPIYIFLPTSLASLLPSSLPPHMTVNSTYDSVFDLPIMHGMKVAYQENWELDREKGRHGPELYAIWNSKAWLLDEGAKNANGGQWDSIFWVDAGSFRTEHSYRAWPAAERIEEIWRRWKGLGEERVFFPIFDTPKSKNREWREEDGPVDEDISIASFFGGSPSAIRWYASAFYAYHAHYLSLPTPLFIGKDQSIINSLFLLFPTRFISVFHNDPHSSARIPPSSILSHRYWRDVWKSTFSAFSPSRALGKCSDEWYYYQ